METTKYPSHQLYGHVKEFGDFVWMWICSHDVEIVEVEIDFMDTAHQRTMCTSSDDFL